MDSGEPQAELDQHSPRAIPVDTPAATANDTEAETPKPAHDSMVTVRLSEPPNLTLDTGLGSNATTTQPAVTIHEEEAETTAPELSIEANNRETMSTDRDSTTTLSTVETGRSLHNELATSRDSDISHDSSSETDEVDWAQLQKTEDEQTKDEETDNVSSYAILLKRLS